MGTTSKQAGIKKDITFHCFRHSFATLQLTLGVDIYTVSKLLGHKSLKMTQIYARIIDKKKQSAAGQLAAAWEWIGGLAVLQDSHFKWISFGGGGQGNLNFYAIECGNDQV